MKLKFFQLFSISLLIFFGTIFASAQIDASTPSGVPRKEEFPKSINETLKKHEIERTRKNHEELLKNGEEAVQLSNELAESLEKSDQLSAKDTEKLEKLEKLVKKIRNKLGGDDESESEKPKFSSIKSVVNSLRETTGNLLDELKKTSRYTISVLAIQSSNTLLELVRSLKFWKN